LIGLIIAALMFTLVMPRNETMHAPDTRADETQNWSS
jgi:hypothetical protein